MDMHRLGTPDSHPYALYCSRSGVRLSPEAGARRPNDTPVAVIVCDDGVTVPVFGDTMIGREPDHDHRVTSGEWASIRLTDPDAQLSRSHLLIRVKEWNLELIDLGSTNGTLTETPDGWQRLLPGRPQPVRDGQRFRLGNRTLSIHNSGR